MKILRFFFSQLGCGSLARGNGGTTFPTFNTIKTGSLLQKVGFVLVTLILLSIILNYHSEIQTLVITLGAVAFLVFSYNNNSMCFPFKNVVSMFFLAKSPILCTSTIGQLP